MDVEKTMEFLLEQQAHFNENLARLTRYQIDAGERHDREMAALRAELRRGVHLSIEEARQERQRRHALAEAQRVTEEKLNALIEIVDRIIRDRNR